MTPSDKSDAALESIIGLVTAGAGLTVGTHRRSWFEDRIRRAMKRLGVTDAARFLRHLGDADRLDDFAAELAVGETYFFRDPGQLDFIRREVLPDIKIRRGYAHRLRGWSAGCASGEEAYSLAILFEQEGLGSSWELLGTDISETALAKARQGRYAAWSFRGDACAADVPYFTRQGDDRFSVAQRFVGRISWRRLNLVTGSYPASSNGTAECDLILCRNVLIYFEPDTVRAVQEKLFASLAEGGWLVLGPSDPPMPALDGCEPVITKAGVFYRRQSRATETVPVCPPNLASPIVSWNDKLPEAPQAANADARDIVEARPAERQTPMQGTDPIISNAPDWVAHVQLLAKRGDGQAAACAVADGIAQFPLAAELHHLSAIVLLGIGRHEEAAQAARRALYLDRSLAFGHVTLALILHRAGRNGEAARAYRNALALLTRLQPDTVVPLSEGQSSRQLIAAVSAQLATLASNGEVANG